MKLEVNIMLKSVWLQSPQHTHMTIVPAFGILCWMFLWGRIIDSLIKTSSFTCTSYATTLTPSILTQCPMTFYQPMIEFLINTCLLISVCGRIVELEMREPAPILQSLPMTTSGPSTADSSTWADGWISTEPMILFPSASDRLTLYSPSNTL